MLLLSLTLFTSCFCSLEGSQDLGKNFALFEGDKIEDRVIIYCAENKDKCCTGGMYVIPTYETHYNTKGHYNEYVQEAKSDKKWIIAKTFKINDKENFYWILNKNFEVPEEYKNSPLPE